MTDAETKTAPAAADAADGTPGPAGTLDDPIREKPKAAETAGTTTVGDLKENGTGRWVQVYRDGKVGVAHRLRATSDYTADCGVRAEPVSGRLAAPPPDEDGKTPDPFPGRWVVAKPEDPVCRRCLDKNGDLKK